MEVKQSDELGNIIVIEAELAKVVHILVVKQAVTLRYIL